MHIFGVQVEEILEKSSNKRPSQKLSAPQSFGTSYQKRAHHRSINKLKHNCCEVQWLLPPHRLQGMGSWKWESKVVSWVRMCFCVTTFINNYQLRSDMTCIVSLSENSKRYVRGDGYVDETSIDHTLLGALWHYYGSIRKRCLSCCWQTEEIEVIACYSVHRNMFSLLYIA